ncbi:hypothetical protein CJ030_MR5G000436 [Morella rubra]|uniref:Uncharacterized protein n=1 Tax=Morella rubra TaxID=262757 RepID=A0A6A1VNL4_9ROSI|nr:hypothetical protein CJ030_MR5G000436 [Morella rubra]
MSNLLWKTFYRCFSKLKCLPTIQSSPLPNEDDDDYPSFTSTTGSIIVKNYNSLYDLTSDSTSKSLTVSATDFFSSADDSDETDSPPDFATIFASQRFFFSSPGLSKSIIESQATGQDPDNVSATDFFSSADDSRSKQIHPLTLPILCLPAFLLLPPLHFVIESQATGQDPGL